MQLWQARYIQRCGFRTTHKSGRRGCPMAAEGPSRQQQQPAQPVILLDVMDTIVTDPFFDHMPRYFNLTFKVGQWPPD